MTMADDSAAWRGLCEFLDSQPYDRARQPEIPQEFWWLLSRNYGARRRAIGAVFYWSGLGWRLHREWRDRLRAAGLL